MYAFTGSRRQDASVSSSSGVTVLNSAKGKIENHKVVSVGIRGNKIAVNGKAIDSVVTLKPASGDIFTFEENHTAALLHYERIMGL